MFVLLWRVRGDSYNYSFHIGGIWGFSLHQKLAHPMCFSLVTLKHQLFLKGPFFQVTEGCKNTLPQVRAPSMIRIARVGYDRHETSNDRWCLCLCGYRGDAAVQGCLSSFTNFQIQTLHYWVMSFESTWEFHGIQIEGNHAIIAEEQVYCAELPAQQNCAHWISVEFIDLIIKISK